MIQQLLTQIEGQLFEHFEPFLQQGVCAEEIERAEERMGVTFPQPLKDLYRARNGEQDYEPGLFFGLTFLPLEDLVMEWEGMSRLWDDPELAATPSFSIPPLAIKERYFYRGWIPLAMDGGGNYLGVDVDPDRAGVYGQIINFGRDEETKYVVAQSVTDLLAFLLNTLERGLYTIDDEESWSYGEQESIHFLDAMKSVALPVLQLAK